MLDCASLGLCFDFEIGATSQGTFDVSRTPWKSQSLRFALIRYLFESITLSLLELFLSMDRRHVHP